AREERMAVVADFEVQLGLRRACLPGRTAGAARLDLVILGVNPFLHSLLLAGRRKRQLYQTPWSVVRGSWSVVRGSGPRSLVALPWYDRLCSKHFCIFKVSPPIPGVPLPLGHQIAREAAAVAHPHVRLDVVTLPHAGNQRRHGRVFQDE